MPVLKPLLVPVGVLGLLVGSFLNVVIYRLPRGESLVRPGSHCPRCGAGIRPWHNVPVVSWLALRGRCAHCRVQISPRYLLVEAGTGALFVAVTARLGLTWALPAYLYFAAIAVTLAVIDVDVLRLPNAIVLPSYLVGAVLLIPAAAAGAHWPAAVRGLIAMAVLLAGYFALAVGFPGLMGLGDVKLAGVLGLYLGWLSWSSVLVGTFTGFLFGGAVSAVLLMTGRASRKTAVPFGPCMLAGAMLAIFAAGPIAHWYGTLLVPTT